MTKLALAGAVALVAVSLGGCFKTGPALPSVLEEPVVQCAAGYAAYREYVRSGSGGDKDHAFWAAAYARLQSRCAAHDINLPNVPRT